MAQKKEKVYPIYKPSDDVKNYISHCYKRLMEIHNYRLNIGVENEYRRMERNYENMQQQKKKGELPNVNLASPVELVETKSAEESKVMPEVVLVPLFERDRVKCEALQKTAEYVDTKPTYQGSLKRIKMLMGKNLYGSYFMWPRWKETYRQIKVVKEYSRDDKNRISGIKYDEMTVVAQKDIGLEVLPPTRVYINEGARDMSEVYEAYILDWMDYDQAKEEFSIFADFDYVVPKQIPGDVQEILQEQNVVYRLDRTIDCAVIYAYNSKKDEFSIMVNGVLLTPYGNPIPNKYFKEVALTRAICRNMVGRREFHPKGDVALVERLITLKNTCINSLNKAVHLSVNVNMKIPRDIAAKLKKQGLEWSMAGMIETDSREQSEQVQPLIININFQGIFLLIDKIDELITTITGIDSRALLSSVQETATKTAVRQETVQKRINAGLQLIEYDTLYREMIIKLALIRQYYQEEETYIKDDSLEEDKKEEFKIPKMIPTHGEEFKWEEKTRPVTQEQIQALFDAGMEEEMLQQLFVRDKDKDFLFLYDSMDDLFEAGKEDFYSTLTEAAKSAYEKLLKESTYWDMTKGKSKGKSSSFEVRKELFDFPYNIIIRPKGVMSYSELFAKESAERNYPIMREDPNYNQEEVSKWFLEVNQLPQKIMKTDEQKEQEQKAIMEQQQAEQAAQQPQGPAAGTAQGGGMPPELASLLANGAGNVNPQSPTPPGNPLTTQPQ